MSQIADMQADYAMSADVEHQYLAFTLADEEYAVEILRVQEIRCWEAVTTLPNAPEYIKGVINIRGTIVPVADLRMRFGMKPKEYGPMTVVVVLKVFGDDKERVMGIVVDTVSDTYEIPAESIKSAPDMGERVDLEYIKGLATVDDEMVVILDIDGLLSDGHTVVSGS